MRMNLFSVCALTTAVSGAAAGPSPARDEISRRPDCIAQPHPGPQTAFQFAFDRFVKASTDPERTRGSLLLRLGGAPTCYPDDLSPEEWEAIFQATGLLPPGDGGGDGVQVRYYTEPSAWLGEAQIDTAGRAQAARLTYSFPDDGTTWGLSASGFPTGPNVLNANLLATFGDTDRGREHIRQAIASWRLHSGLAYTEVADNNSPMDQLVGRVLVRGDIRIGSTDLNASVLAYNAYPLGSGSTSLSGGDMCLNSQYFLPAYFGGPGSDFRYFRNTIAHEHGHGLGLRHSVPCDVTKIMEPQVGGTIQGIQIDDIRGGQRNYGDRFSGNISGITAAPLGELASPTPRSIFLSSLSTNSFNGYNNSSEDWFTFTLATPRTVTIIADPYGGVYSAAPQSSGCNGSPLIEIDAQATANLRIELRRPANTQIQFASANGRGFPETLNAGTLPAGTYFVKVRDINTVDIPNNQRVQLYNLTIQVDSAPLPPLAVAGINKRVAANTDCWLIGHINSRAQAPGATISSYSWDLDADGVFEASGSPTTFQYVSNGTHQATLRVTDSSGTTSTDSISVAVYNAVTSVASVFPPGASPGTTIPVTIHGTNFKGVTAASQVTVSGSGASVSGTPVVNHLGTQISGLSVTVTAGASLGARNVSITNSDGLGSAGTGINTFTVGNVSGACCFGTSCVVTTQAACASGGVWQGGGTACGTAGNPTTCCRANFDGVDGVTVPDIFAFLSAWFAGNPAANIDGVNGVAVPDIFAFLSLWFAGCPG